MDATARTELIDRYLKDELTGKELALFEAQLQKEPALLQEVELQRQAIAAIKEAEIRNILRRTHAQIKKAEEAAPLVLKSGRLFANPDQFMLKSAMAEIELPEPAGGTAIKKTGPECIAIAYEGETVPAFKIDSSSGKNLFTCVIIYPGSGTQSFHYRLVYYENHQPTLHLYGHFNPTELTLLYRKQENQDIFKLRVNTKEYFLRKNELTQPLSEQEQPNKAV